MSIRRISIWGRSREIEMEQLSKSRWVATGMHLGKWITAEDRTAADAAKRWVSEGNWRDTIPPGGARN